MNKETHFAPQRGERKLTLGELLHWLAQDGMVSAVEAEKLARNRKADHSNLHPLVIISEQKWRSLLPPGKPLSVEFLTEWLAARIGMPYFHIDPLQLNFGGIANVVSKSYAERLKIMPVEVGEGEVTIATAEPFLTDWVADLERILNLKIRLVLASPLDINHYLPEIYSLANSVQLASKARAGQTIGVQNFEQLIELGKNKNLDANEQHIVTLVDWLFKYAFEQRASDIHLEPRRNIGIVRFRIDGVLHQVYQLPATVTNAITNRIKLLGRMDMVEKRRPQDGRIKTVSADGDEIELRLSTMPTAFGEKLVMRIFDPEILVKNFTDLGFSREQTVLWNDWTRQPNGIILVTGPTGSGKTTTLYSTLKQLATPEVNVCSVEDPIEMIEPAFNQMQVQHNIGLNFADGVRTLLRQDPDIIMVGEIRDAETAEMAIQAALTGQHPAAAGPGHHHGGRNPRCGNRRNGDSGGAYRASGAVVAAYQRCAFRDHAPARTGCAGLPAQFDAAGGDGAAPRAYPVPALQGKRRNQRRDLAGTGQPVESRQTRAGLRRHRLPRMPHDRLSRAHRHLRDAAAQRGNEKAGGRECRARQDQGVGAT